MIGWKFEFGTLSDLSSTIFSVFLLLMILLFDTALNSQSVSNAPASIDRAPLRASEMADLLFQRRLSAPGTRIDILPGGLKILNVSAFTSASKDVAGQDISVRDLEQWLSVRRLPEPFSIYVFDHDLYGDVARALLHNKYAWHEISVPAALRDQGQRGWSNDFKTLLAQQTTKEAFIRNLASLLGGGTQKSGGQFFQTGGSAASQHVPLSERITQMLMQLWTRIPVVAIINILMCLCGLGVMMRIERRGGQGKKEMS